MNKVIRALAILVASLIAFGFFVVLGLTVQAAINDPTFPTCRAFSGVCSAVLVYSGYGAAIFGLAAGLIAARICAEPGVVDFGRTFNVTIMVASFLLGVIMLWGVLEGTGLVPRYASHAHIVFGPQQAAVFMLIGLASFGASLGSAIFTVGSKA